MARGQSLPLHRLPQYREGHSGRRRNHGRLGESAMYEFAYQRPASLEEAVKALAADADAKPLAGGMTLLPTIKQRLAKPSALLDLSGIPSLAYIKRSGDGIEIGAMTRHVDVARSAEVQQVIPALAQLAGGIGDPQVRNRGTMGGSVANSDPAADYPA